MTSGDAANRSELPPGPGRELVDLLRWLRRDRPLSIRQIAAKSGVSPGHVSDVFNGKKSPSPDVVEKIVNIFTVDPNVVRKARTLAHDLLELNRYQRETTRERGGTVVSGANSSSGAKMKFDDSTAPVAPHFVSTGSVIQSGSGTNIAITGVVHGDVTVSDILQ